MLVGWGQVPCSPETLRDRGFRTPCSGCVRPAARRTVRRTRTPAPSTVLGVRTVFRPTSRLGRSRSARTLTTQGLSLTLPLSVTMGDSFAVPSLAAALLLGLRERMGGNPDHISVVTVPVPVADGAAGEVREALLLHDTVPGRDGLSHGPRVGGRGVAGPGDRARDRGQLRVPAREPAGVPPVSVAVLSGSRGRAAIARGSEAALARRSCLVMMRTRGRRHRS